MCEFEGNTIGIFNYVQAMPQQKGSSETGFQPGLTTAFGRFLILKHYLAVEKSCSDNKGAQ